MFFFNSLIEQFTLVYCFWYTSINVLPLLIVYTTITVFEIFFYNFTNPYGVFFFFNKFITNLIFKSLVATKLGQNLFYSLTYVLNYTYVYNWTTMIPFYYPILSFYGTAFFFTISCFFGLILIVLLDQKLDFFAIFTCMTVSPFLLELFATINLASYLIRFFSLTIRAFASSAASSIILSLISNIFIFSFFYFFYLWKFFLVFLVFFFLIFINSIEFFLPLVQAQIFNFLIYIYYSESKDNYEIYFNFFMKKCKEQTFLFSLTNNLK